MVVVQSNQSKSFAAGECCMASQRMAVRDQETLEIKLHLNLIYTVRVSGL